MAKSERLASSSLISFATQGGSKIINFTASVLMIRIVAPEVVGLFTALLAGSQFVNTIGRAGTNYAYTTLLHSKNHKENQSDLTVTFISFTALISLILAITSATNLFEATDINSSNLTYLNSILRLGLTIMYFSIDAYSEILWDIELAMGQFKRVFTRNLYISAMKSCVPLLIVLALPSEKSYLALTTGLLISSTVSLLAAKRQPSRLETVGQSSPPPSRKISFKLLIELLKLGLPLAAVPISLNIFLWPILLNIISYSGTSELEGLRIGQLCAQGIGIITGAVMPVLLVKSSENPNQAQNNVNLAFNTCWIAIILVLSSYYSIDKYLIPWIFGTTNFDSLVAARMMVLSAAASGLGQIPLQQVFKPRKIIVITVLQVACTIASAFIGILLFKGSQGLMPYLIISTAAPILLITLLPIINIKPSTESMILKIILLWSCLFFSLNSGSASILFSTILLTVGIASSAKTMKTIIFKIFRPLTMQ